MILCKNTETQNHLTFITFTLFTLQYLSENIHLTYTEKVKDFFIIRTFTTQKFTVYVYKTDISTNKSNSSCLWKHLFFCFSFPLTCPPYCRIFPTLVYFLPLWKRKAKKKKCRDQNFFVHNLRENDFIFNYKLL